MAELILEGLRKSYGQTEVIHGVDLRIESGNLRFLLARRAAANRPCCA